LFTAAYLRYCHYRHPVSGEPTTLARLSTGWLYSAQHAGAPGTLWAPGLSLWKTAILKPFLKTAENRAFCLNDARKPARLSPGERGEKQNGRLRQTPSIFHCGEWKMGLSVPPGWV
jgi:capsular polysaccharide export protein